MQGYTGTFSHVPVRAIFQLSSLGVCYSDTTRANRGYWLRIAQSSRPGSLSAFIFILQECQMSSPSNRQSTTSTIFGSVNQDQITYYRNRGWMSGGSRTDVPLRHVTSVREETSRKPIRGIFALLAGVVFIFGVGSIGILIGILFILLSILLFWGWPRIAVNTAGGDLSYMSGFPWQRDQAGQFTSAVRAALFQN